MQDKTNAVFAENQEDQAIDLAEITKLIDKLETEAGQILRAIGRRCVVIATFPNNRLNASYRDRNHQALEAYGKMSVAASFLRDKYGIQKEASVEVNQGELIETVLAA